MLITLILKLMEHRERGRAYAWTPDVDLSDHHVYAALLTHTNY